MEGKVFTTYSGDRLVGKQEIEGDCTERIWRCTDGEEWGGIRGMKGYVGDVRGGEEG